MQFTTHVRASRTGVPLGGRASLDRRIGAARLAARRRADARRRTHRRRV